MTRDVKTIWERASSEMDKTRLLASKVPHSSELLHALSITACGLHLSDEAIRVAVSLRLGLNICEPHPCPGGATVTSRGTHGLSCKRSFGRTTRHQQINDAIWRALMRADVPSTKETAGLLRGDGERPNGLTLVPWHLAKWTQSHVGHHCCGHSGQLLHANDVSDNLWSGGGSSNTEES